MSTYWIGLYTNDFFPVSTSTVNDFAPPLGGWYAPQQLNDWGPVFLNAANLMEVDHSTLEWIANVDVQPDNIYGYYVFDNNNQLAWAERIISRPFIPMDLLGARCRITPRLMAGPLQL